MPGLSKGCKSKIWAFEPNPENYKCAKITLEINSISNVNIKNVGLGNEKRDAFLQIYNDSGKSLGGASRFVNNNKQAVEVPIKKIDDIIPEDRSISVLHLDVEGYEKFALLGGLTTIERCKPILILETVPPNNWMKEYLYCLGYKKVGKVHANTIFIAN